MRKEILTTLLLSIAVTLITFPTGGLAVPANPNLIEVNQPDGSEIRIKVRGDEFFSWHEDEEGSIIVKNSETDYWTYAQKDSTGKIIPSAKNVSPKVLKTKSSTNSEQENTPKLTKKDIVVNSNSCLKIKETDKDVQFASPQKASSSTGASNVSALETVGTKTNFVLLIQFKDYKFNGTEEQVRKHFDDLFNKENYKTDGAVGSVKDYFKEVSYGKLEYKSVISPVVTIDESYLNYAYKNGDISYTRIRAMIKAALKQLDDSGYNFKEIWPNTNTPEGFTVIHAGGGAENGNYNFIWSHSWNLTGSDRTFDGIRFFDYHIEPAGRGYNGNEGLVRIGVICHESVHFFGIPDLYDTYYESKGLGDFCLMALGVWNGNNGTTPAHPSAWVKYKLGWIEPKSAGEGENSIGVSAKDNTAFYKMSPENFSKKEYFLIENRQSYGFDSALPGTNRGLLIYHVDESVSDNDNASHYLVDLEEADGRDDLVYNRNSGTDSDYFRAGANTVFNDTSKPSSKSYSGASSKIDISNISASGSIMYFYLPEEENLEKFASSLNLQGYEFVKLVSKITTNQNFLSNANNVEKNQISKYFSLTTSGGKSANDMAEVYYKYVEDKTVYGVHSDKMAKVSYAQAKTVQNLNSVLEKSTDNSNITVESVGNISLENETPLHEETTPSAVPTKRFTGVDLVEKIEDCNNGIGCLMINMDNMEQGIEYDIIEVKEDMDISDYFEYIFVRGVKAVSNKDLSKVAAFPNPARRGYINITNLPTDSVNVQVEIYTISGQFVKRFSEGDLIDIGLGNKKIKWNCKNENGQDVAPGVYMVLLKSNSDKKKMKIAIIR